MLKAPLNKIISFSSVDGPGNRVAIFFQGCNFNCKYCHNPETIHLCVSCGTCVEKCPTGALTLDENNKVRWNQDLCCRCETCIKACPNSSSPLVEWVTPEGLFKKIEKYLTFTSGVTVSGGECTLQHEFLVPFFKMVKAKGKTVFVDSNGLLDFKEMPELVQVMDMAMIDVKAGIDEEHQDLVGQSNKKVLENVAYLAEIGKLFEIRTVVIPDLLHNEVTVSLASDLIKNYPQVRYKLIKYRQNGVRKHILESPSPEDATIQQLKNLAREKGVLDIVIT